MVLGEPERRRGRGEAPKMPPHLTLCRDSSSRASPKTPWRIAILPPPPAALDSRWDSTRRSAQSPNPEEILSRNSPEKLRLPHPTDRDLATFWLKEEIEAWPPLPGLSSRSSAPHPRFTAAASAASLPASWCFHEYSSPPAPMWYACCLAAGPPETSRPSFSWRQRAQIPPGLARP
ncbi:unnamed protein product [Spirodela intermedia]|uniref:Uncharacterized protein n=1 Tax=Spirodela intermedia TaxID=51605 RepID=A0A7I8JDG6_SPIIN|nr:unnamed protein product [Spirodela intermedia]CAA6668139.1 unnamed protein product [Spirodela intermedia]